MDLNVESKGRTTGAGFTNPVLDLGAEIPSDHDPSRVLHTGVYCDGSGCPKKNEEIRGPRYHCSVCDNVDLCSNCIRQPDHGHSTTHAFFECLKLSAFVHTGGMPKDEARRVHEMAAKSGARDLSEAIKATARQMGATLWSETRVPSQDPNTPIIFREYNIDEEGKVSVKNVPADVSRRSIGAPAPGDFSDRVLHHPSRVMGFLTGKCKLHYYERDQFYHDVWAGIAATRVVDLQPGKDDDALCCSIRSIRIGDGTSYEALSYTWKETGYERPHSLKWDDDMQQAYRAMADCTHPVYVDEDSFLQVSLGLRDALLRYRHPNEVRTLWIDQLCIDQSNISERSFQVQFMSQIYNQSSRVVVWIGDQSPSTQAAFELIEKLAHFTSVQGLTPAEFEKSGWDLPPIGSEPWVALMDFFRRPVFGRGWVVQEIVVARDVVVKCGKYETEFWKVGTAADIICRSEWLPRYQMETGNGQVGGESGHFAPRPDYTSIIYNLRQDFHARKPRTLQELLQATQLFATSDPRDQMFAIFNVARGMRIADHEELPRPDYEKSVGAVCEEVTRFIVRSGQSSLHLGNAGVARQSRTGIPSWVVDWTAGADAHAKPTMFQYTPYTAAGDSDPLIAWLDDTESVLATSSFKCMTVAAVGEPRHRLADDITGPVLSKWADMATRTCSDDSSRHEAAMAFYRTVTGDCTLHWKEFPVSEEYLMCVAAWIWGQVAIEGHPDPLSAGDSIFGWVQSCIRQGLMDMEFFEAHYASVVSQTAFMTMHRRFFVTECGRFGLGPAEMQPGDEVHVVSGGKAPFVLRPNALDDDEDECRHTLIGEAYVHDIMRGEVLNWPDFGWDQLLIQ